MARKRSLKPPVGRKAVPIRTRGPPTFHRAHALLLYIPLLDTGVSPSGKASDFDSVIRGFESLHPSHMLLSTSGLSRQILNLESGVRIPVGVPEVALRRGLRAQVVIVGMAADSRPACCNKVPNWERLVLFAPVDKWLSCRPFTAEMRVRFPPGVPAARSRLAMWAGVGLPQKMTMVAENCGANGYTRLLANETLTLK